MIAGKVSRKLVGHGNRKGNRRGSGTERAAGERTRRTGPEMISPMKIQANAVNPWALGLDPGPRDSVCSREWPVYGIVKLLLLAAT